MVVNSDETDIIERPGIVTEASATRRGNGIPPINSVGQIMHQESIVMINRRVTLPIEG